MADKKKLRFLAAACGVFSGIINGLFGSGGGLVLVPSLKSLGLSQKQAQAGSVFAVLCFCAASAVVYSINAKVNLSAERGYLIGGLIGGALGATLLPRLPDKILRKAFALFALYGAARMLFYA